MCKILKKVMKASIPEKQLNKKMDIVYHGHVMEKIKAKSLINYLSLKSYLYWTKVQLHHFVFPLLLSCSDWISTYE